MKAIDFFSTILYMIRKGTQVNIDINLIYTILIQITTEENNESLRHHHLLETLKYYQQYSSDINKKIELEWLYVSFDKFKSINIESHIIDNPNFFVELVSYVYKPRNSKREDEGLTKDQLENRANNAWKILRKINLFSDHIQEKSLNSDYLISWINQARIRFKEVDREIIGDCNIGQVLSYSPDGEDSIWPHETVRKVLEVVLNEKIENDFLVGKQNQRGIILRDKGGTQEYALAVKYKDDAQKIKFTYPKTSALLSKLAKRYEADGIREDIWEELR